MMLTRKEFLSSVVTAVAGAAGAALFVACGSSSSSSDAGGGNCVANGTHVDIGAPIHGHTMTVAKADITAAVDKTYDIQGSSTHNHKVTIMAAWFTMLASNTTVMTMSTTDAGH